MEIKRDKYLNDLIARMHNRLIKVVTGVRRCGKSYLVFHLFRDYLLQNGVGEDHIIVGAPYKEGRCLPSLNHLLIQFQPIAGISRRLLIHHKPYLSLRLPSGRQKQNIRSLFLIQFLGKFGYMCHHPYRYALFHTDMGEIHRNLEGCDLGRRSKGFIEKY